MTTKISTDNIQATSLELLEGGGGTTVYATIAELPLSGVEAGEQAFVTENNRLYLWTGAGWFNIALINTNPSITSGPNATYEFDTNGTPIVITLVASDPEEVPITWSHQVTSGTLGNTAVITSNGNVFTLTPSTNEADAGIFEVTFTASDGINIDTATAEFTLQFVSSGQVAFTTAGTHTWVVPEGVTTVCAVLIGAGNRGSATTSNKQQGGAGGGLRYINDLPVTPGETLTVVVGAPAYSSGTGDTTLLRGANTLLWAQGGAGYAGGGGTGGGAGPYGGTVGGGDGGLAGGNGNGGGGGGGGAGGYAGSGGNGGASGAGGGGAGSGGGAGGGGGSSSSSGGGGGGGGTGLFGQGSNGTGGTFTNPGGGGGGGSSGADGANGSGGTGGSGGAYGGGAGGSSTTQGQTAGGGAARIIWGPDRAFPSTNTQDV